MAGPPPGFQRMLDRKYDILEEKASAATTRARAGADLQEAQADKVRARTQQLSNPAGAIGGQGALGRILQGLQQGPASPKAGLVGSAPTVPRTGGTQAPPAPRQTTRVAPSGFGLADDDTEQRRQITRVFGSIFGGAGGL